MLSSLLTGSMIRASTQLREHLVPPAARSSWRAPPDAVRRFPPKGRGGEGASRRLGAERDNETVALRRVAKQNDEPDPIRLALVSVLAGQHPQAGLPQLCPLYPHFSLSG
jgi:hypothetical protein